MRNKLNSNSNSNQMGLHKGGGSEMVSLASRHTDGDIQALVNRVNDFLVSVSIATCRDSP